MFPAQVSPKAAAAAVLQLELDTVAKAGGTHAMPAVVQAAVQEAPASPLSQSSLLLASHAEVLNESGGGGGGDGGCGGEGGGGLEGGGAGGAGEDGGGDGAQRQKRSKSASEAAQYAEASQL